MPPGPPRSWYPKLFTNELPKVAAAHLASAGFRMRPTFDITEKTMRKSLQISTCLFWVLALSLVTATFPREGYTLADDPLMKERQRAVAAREAAVARAAKDPARPMFHFRPPARWMNDICGAIYHNGYHHIFYQSNPFADDTNGWCLGHARSK
mgnify:CR=1 FL=1